MSGSDGLEAPEEDHAYFRAVEDVFIALRGAPFLLSPADWQVAQRWRRLGVPLALVRRVLGEIFEARQRKSGDPIQGLRYCRSAVERAWERQRRHDAPGHSPEPQPLDVDRRLRTLAGSLPTGLPGGEQLRARIRALGGEAPEVEEALGHLERELLVAAEALLGESRRAELEEDLAEALASLADRLPPGEELQRTGRRLREQLLRQRTGIPVLSLFSPEAEGG